MSLQLLMVLIHVLKMALMMLLLADGDLFMSKSLIMGFIISRMSCVAAENNIFVAANYASVVEGNK